MLYESDMNRIQDEVNKNSSNLLDELNSQIDSNNGRWSEEEHIKFIEAIFIYGNEWRKVKDHIKTRSSSQARSHAQKYFLKLHKDLFKEDNSLFLKPGDVNQQLLESILNYLQTYLLKSSSIASKCIELNSNNYKLKKMLESFCKYREKQCQSYCIGRAIISTPTKKIFNIEKIKNYCKIKSVDIINRNSDLRFQNNLNMIPNSHVPLIQNICNNIIYDNSNQYNTINFNFFPISLKGDLVSNNLYDNLKTLYNQKEEKDEIIKKRNNNNYISNNNNNPFSINFNMELDAQQQVRNENQIEKEFNIFDINFFNF